MSERLYKIGHREKQMFDMITQKHIITRSELAKEMDVSIPTIATYLIRLYEQLPLKDNSIAGLLVYHAENKEISEWNT